MSWMHNDPIPDWFDKVTNNKDWGKWTYTPMGTNSLQPWPQPPSELDMVKDILSRTEDEGFFGDIIAWLTSDAPRRLKTTLRELCPPMHTGPVSYERLCEVLYQVGFRASEVLERRMTLGPGNRWVRKYFEDFPPRSRP